MRRAALLLALLAAPALAVPKPPLPLPPLLLDAAAPVITVEVDGQPLLLRVDPGSTRHVQINATAAARLDLANPARRIAGKPVEIERVSTQIGKVLARESITPAIGLYAGRPLPLVLAWSVRNHVDGADGIIGPMFLPHDEIRFSRRAPGAGDHLVVLPMAWSNERGLTGKVRIGSHDIDVQISPQAPETIATAAAAAWLIEADGGRLDGDVRPAVIAQGVRRPVRDVVLGTPATLAGITLDRVATRLFDWSGTTSLPPDPADADEIVVRARFEAQYMWAKVALGNDHLGRCAELTWHRTPLSIDLVCPG